MQIYKYIQQNLPIARDEYVDADKLETGLDVLFQTSDGFSFSVGAEYVHCTALRLDPDLWEKLGIWIQICQTDADQSDLDPSI